MHFSTLSASIFLAICVFLAPAPANAGITAFSSFQCDGTKGTDVACDGRCIPFTGRHSFRVDAGNGLHCVTTYTDIGCPSGGQEFTFQNQDGQCTSVNTGTPIKSFRCASGNVCIA